MIVTKSDTLCISPRTCHINTSFLQPHLSTERELVLDNVDFTTSGTFRCEVSGDAPMFQTASTEGVMAVVGKMRPTSVINHMSNHWNLIVYI